MTPEQFQSTSIAILRTAVGWQTKIAAKLGVDGRTVRRWLKAGAIPDKIATELAAMIGQTDLSPWPRDEWLIGDADGGDGKRREYIYHMQTPRFIARVVAAGDDGEPEAGESPCDVVSGTVYTSLGFILCEIDWIDQPQPGEVVALLEAACDAIDAMA